MADLFVPGQVAGASNLDRFERLSLVVVNLMEILKNHKSVIDEQNSIINIHGERIKMLELNIEALRKEINASVFENVPEAHEEAFTQEYAAQDGADFNQAAEADPEEVDAS